MVADYLGLYVATTAVVPEGVVKNATVVGPVVVVKNATTVVLVLAANITLKVHYISRYCKVQP